MRIHHRYVGVACAVALAAPGTAAAQTVEHTLSVVGVGQVELTPNRGSFSVSVDRWARRGAQARTEANRRIRAIVAGIRGLHVPREQIQTSDVSLSRVVRREGKHGPKRIRYRASASLSISIEGLKTLGRAIDVATERGATAVYGPRLSFTPELRESGLQQAEAGALEDARTRADAAAAATGQQIVGVQSINLDPDASDLSSSNALLDSSASSGGGDSVRAPTRIFAGRRKVRTEARVTYLIEPLPASGA
jgi:uncharacterized protein YggE